METSTQTPPQKQKVAEASPPLNPPSPNAHEERLKSLRTLVEAALEQRELSARAAIKNDMAESYRLAGLASLYAYEALEIIDGGHRLDRRTTALCLMDQTGCTAVNATWIVDRVRRFANG